MKQIIIFKKNPFISSSFEKENDYESRLFFTFDFVFINVLGIDYHITQDENEFQSSPLFKINYSHKSIESDLQIISTGLLFENGVVEKEINISQWNNLPIFFQTSETEIPFDIFSAIFYLISRYEEYLPYEPDLYKRFPHTQSIAFQNDFLDIPLVDLWIEELKNCIKLKKSNLIFAQKKFQFIPTYDIDIAYSFKGKGFLRNLGSAIKDICSANFKEVKNRILVLSNQKKDPYDCYSFLDELHTKYSFKPIYFFLLGEGSEFDKNIDRNSIILQKLIKSTQSKYEIGIHPSWKSHQHVDILENEKNRIKNVTKSRQHYIRFTLPETFRNLIKLGITDDYSMGYGSINGFRASTSQSFFWFDLENNITSSLQLHPFCYMECNSFYEQNYTKEKALEEILHYLKTLKSINGKMITVWHNFSLGTDNLWEGWKEEYVEFVEQVFKETIF